MKRSVGFYNANQLLQWRLHGCHVYITRYVEPIDARSV